MKQLTAKNKRVLMQVFKGIIEGAKDSPIGSPAGAIYACLMHFGASLNQYKFMVDTLVRTGLLSFDEENDTYHATEKGILWASKVKPV